MRSITYTTLQDIPPDVRWLYHLLEEGTDSMAPLLKHYAWPYFQVQINLHQPAGEPFFLIAMPDGEYVALSPMDEPAYTLLTAQVPDAQAWQESGAARWANRQTWRPIIAQCWYRKPDGYYEAYDPRLPLPADAPTLSRTLRTPEEQAPCV